MDIRIVDAQFYYEGDEPTVHIQWLELTEKGAPITKSVRGPMKHFGVENDFVTIMEKVISQQEKTQVDLSALLTKEFSFELYDKMNESIKLSDWAATYISKDDLEKKG